MGGNWRKRTKNLRWGKMNRGKFPGKKQGRWLFFEEPRHRRYWFPFLIHNTRPFVDYLDWIVSRKKDLSSPMTFRRSSGSSRWCKMGGKPVCLFVSRENFRFWLLFLILIWLNEYWNLEIVLFCFVLLPLCWRDHRHWSPTLD